MSIAPSISPIPYFAGLYGAKAASAPHSHAAGAVLRRFAQGAGSALLVFAGADTMTDAAAASPASGVNLASLDGVLQTLFSGGYAGPLQMGAAVLLFLTAGQCIARFFGLIFAATVIVLYLQGVTVDDLWVFFDHFVQRMSAAASAFQSAEVM